MQAIFLDGESKSGKTAVGRAIRKTLEAERYTVRLVVTGNFFRQVTLIALRHKPETDDGGWLETAARDALRDPALYDEVDERVLNTPEIDALVSRVGQFGFMQAAGNEWVEKSAQRALDNDMDVVLLDGRNRRSKLQDWLRRTETSVALELIIACRAEVAAARYLAHEGDVSPSKERLIEATHKIESRRQMDRERAEAAYAEPSNPVTLLAGERFARQAVHVMSADDVPDPPRPVLFDNSDVPLRDGLATVTALAAAVLDPAGSK